jgi:hypothetical protein
MHTHTAIAEKPPVLPTAADARQHERVSFFLVPVERERLPVWVFVPESTGEGHAGVVVNMGEGGLQILTAAARPLTADLYDMHLIIGAPEDAPDFSGRVRRIWSRAVGSLGTLQGMQIESADSDAAEFLRAAAPSPHTRNWVRCVLRPV